MNSPSSAAVRFKDRLKDLYWKIGGTDLRIRLEKHQKPFFDLVPAYEYEEVNKAFLADNRKWDHQEIIAELEDVLVEPDCAYAIQGWRTIVELSAKKGRFGVPSPVSVLKAKLTGSLTSMESAILLDGSIGSNYFYFHADLLSKIHLLREHYDLAITPVLVGARTYNRPYFQELMKLNGFNDINWVLVSNVVKVEKLVVCKPSYYYRSRLEKTRETILQYWKPETRQRRIFVDRDNRRISNFDPIRTILEEYRFEVVNPGSLTMLEQAKIFNSASHVVGIHGAGLANLVFCQSETTKVLEITPSVLIHTHYYWMCASLSIRFDILMANSNKGVYDDFEVDTKTFGDKLEKLVST